MGVRILGLCLVCACALTRAFELDGELLLVEDDEMDADIEVVFQAPPPGTDVVGVLAVLHGCSHGGTDAWPRGPGCPRCVGLPVETHIVGAALSRGWAVAAVTSVDRRSKCWRREDAARIVAAVGAVRARTGAPPVFATLGASSGGGAATWFGDAVGAVAQIKESGAPLDGSHPPVRFVHMARDGGRAPQIRRQVKRLRTAGVDAREFVVRPEVVTAASLRRRGPGPGGDVLPTDAAADAVFKALRDGGFLDAEGYLADDPRRSPWRDAVRRHVPAEDTLVADASRLSEALNAAYAMHEFTDQHLGRTLDWLDERRNAAAAGGNRELS